MSYQTDLSTLGAQADSKIAELTAALTTAQAQVTAQAATIADLNAQIAALKNPPSPTPAPTPAPVPTGKIAGLNDHPVWLRASQDTAFALLSGSGAKSLRIDFPWDVLQPTSKGVFDTLRIGLMDAYVNRCVAAGISVLAVVTSTPGWANGNTGSHVPPTNVADYADFLAQLITRYKGKGVAYEVWNEPNGGWAWTNPDPVKYAALLKAAYTKAKATDPSVIIAAPQLSGPDQASWLDAFYAQGTKNYFDVFGMHGYWWNLGSTVLPYWNATTPNASIFGAFNTRILPVLTKYGDQAKRVWWSETGIATQGSITTETTQAAKVDEAFTAWKAGVIPTMDRLYWYSAIDSIGTGSEQNFGLVNLTGTSPTVPLASEFVPKPAYARFQAQAKM